MSTLQIVLEQGDVLGKAGDVLALKHAGAFHGVDRIVSAKLGVASGPAVGDFVFHDAQGGVQAEEVLFVGVPRLASFRYSEIRAFSKQVFGVLAVERPNARSVLMTIHGPGYGLDESEAFLSQLAGIQDAIAADALPPQLQRISIVELDADRVERLEPALAAVTKERKQAAREAPAGPPVASALEGVGAGSDSKPHAFVAMPFSTAMKNVYYFGIRPPVKAAGWLCERVDQSVFTGDVLDRVKDRIESSRVVIADLTGANPNVFLELGYAWGAGRPTILIIQDAAQLPFDVRGQRCLEYGEDIRKLSKLLKREIAGLRKESIA